MDKIFLGAFGNGSFIKPQFEILGDDSIRIIDNRFEEFPNGGTIYFSATERDIDAVKNKIIKFKIDMDKDISPKYEIYERNSNKYQATFENILELERDEIVEIISLEISLDEFLNDKSKRKIKLNHKPNNKIMLKIDDNCYGPFECMSSVEGLYYGITIFVNGEKINKYRYEDLQKYIYDATFSISGKDSLQFIYNEKKLETIIPVEEIEYIDNEKLAQFLKKIISKSSAIENISEIYDEFLEIVESFSDVEKDDINERNIQRISELLQSVTELRDYKVRITDEYFKNNPNAVNDKQAYLANHEELLKDIARENERYNEICKEYERELELKKLELQQIQKTIDQNKQELENHQQALKKLEDKAIADKKHELDELEKKRVEVEKKYREAEIVKRVFEDDVKKIKADRDDILKDINAKIIQWAEENRNSDIINLLFSQWTSIDEKKETKMLNEKINIADIENAEQVCSLVQAKLNEVGRSVSKDEVYNYLISIVQNYITVFAGEPGTGKTSLCKLLAKALGIYDLRFAEILVERGWTSSKDLIGYYNPLTKEIEKTQPKFSSCLEKLDFENKNAIAKIPYFVLLDEANLSPIEFYWSHFNHYCDRPEEQQVEYSDGTCYKFGKELKFLATINYDHTTEILSPRFLDRAWVITMGPINMDSVLSSSVDESKALNNEKMLLFETLEYYFDWEKFKDKKMNPVTKERLNRIVGKLQEAGHTLSARSIQMINKYYLVAEEYMSSKEVALDFAVAQKILPLINGNGKIYGDFIRELLAICQDNQLEKSALILQKIISYSKHEFYNFFSL